MENARERDGKACSLYMIMHLPSSPAFALAGAPARFGSLVGCIDFSISPRHKSKTCATFELDLAEVSIQARLYAFANSLASSWGTSLRELLDRKAEIHNELWHVGVRAR